MLSLEIVRWIYPFNIMLLFSYTLYAHDNVQMLVVDIFIVQGQKRGADVKFSLQRNPFFLFEKIISGYGSPNIMNYDVWRLLKGLDGRNEVSCQTNVYNSMCVAFEEMNFLLMQEMLSYQYVGHATNCDCFFGKDEPGHLWFQQKNMNNEIFCVEKILTIGEEDRGITNVQQQEIDNQRATFEAKCMFIEKNLKHPIHQIEEEKVYSKDFFIFSDEKTRGFFSYCWVDICDIGEIANNLRHIYNFSHVTDNQESVFLGPSLNSCVVLENYVQAPSSTFLVEVDDFGFSTLLNVKGTVYLDGTIKVKPYPGVYFKGDKFICLVADSITGSFHTQETYSNFAYDIEYAPKKLSIFSSQDQIILPKEVLPFGFHFLQSVLFETPHDMFCSSDFLFVTRTLTKVNPNIYVDILRSLTPEILRSFVLLSVENHFHFSESFLERFKMHCAKQRSSLSLQGHFFKFLGHIDEWFPMRLNLDSNGVGLSFFNSISTNIYHGYGLGYTHGIYQSGSHPTQQGKDHALYFTPIITYYKDWLFFSGMIMGALNWNTSRRQIFRLYRRTRESHVSGGLSGRIFLSAIYSKSFVDWRPYFSMMSLHYFQPEIMERDFDPLSLAVKAQYSSYLLSEIGLQLSCQSFCQEEALLSNIYPSMRLSWRNIALLTQANDSFQFFFIPQQKNCIVTGYSRTLHQFSIKFGLNGYIKNWEGECWYECSVGSNTLIHVGSLLLTCNV